VNLHIMTHDYEKLHVISSLRKREHVTKIRFNFASNVFLRDFTLNFFFLHLGCIILHFVRFCLFLLNHFYTPYHVYCFFLFLFALQKSSSEVSRKLIQ